MRTPLNPRENHGTVVADVAYCAGCLRNVGLERRISHSIPVWDLHVSCHRHSPHPAR